METPFYLSGLQLTREFGSTTNAPKTSTLPKQGGKPFFNDPGKLEIVLVTKSMVTTGFGSWRALVAWS